MTTTSNDLAYALIRKFDAEHRPPTGDDACLVGHLDYLALLESMRGELEDLIVREVSCSRAWGASWLDVGDSLGVTRQAAQQRFGS